jgi:hypothetical protein
MSVSDVIRHQDIDLHILRILRRGRLDVAFLAEGLPEYRWCDLLSALNRLRDQGDVTVASPRRLSVSIPCRHGRKR